MTGTIEDALDALVLRQSGGFGRRECEPGWEWRPVLADYDFWFVLSGSGSVVLNEAPARALIAGSLLLLRPGDEARFAQAPDDRMTVLYCHFEFLDRSGAAVTLAPDLLPGPFVQVKQLGPVADTLYRIVRRLRDGSPLGRYAASGMLMDLFAQIHQQDAAQRGLAVGLDTRLQDAVERILERPARRWTLDEVARPVGLSAAQLSRLFVTQLDTTFRRYTLDVRLDRGAELLRHTSLSVNQVALVLGYTDQFLFSRQFRAKYGEPPSAYRASVHNASVHNASAPGPPVQPSSVHNDSGS